MSDADIGTGAAVEVETAAGSGTYTALAEVLSCPPPPTEVDSVEVTHMGSGRDREYIPGLRNPGVMEVTLNHVAGSATDDFIEAWIASAEVRSVRMTYGNNESVTFDGFPTNYAPDPPMDDRQTATLSIQASGAKTRS